MTTTVHIQSSAQFAEILRTSKVVVADFYADWCSPCKQIAPIYEQLSTSMSRENVITFVKINSDHQKEIAQAYRVTALPTFILFQNGKEINKVTGADKKKLQEMLKKLDAAAASGSGDTGEASGSALSGWKGAAVPRGYSDITNQIELRGLSLLNADEDAGSVRVLFDDSKPSSLGNAASTKKDWVVSGADDQLLLFMPFQSIVKAHTIQVTSLPAAGEDDPMRPEEIKLFTNKPHNMDFDEADNEQETQSITLSADDWNAEGTATVGLRFVKFQKVTSLIVYVVKGAGDGDTVRLDRIRILGESGEKREMGKLEKVGE